MKMSSATITILATLAMGCDLLTPADACGAGILYDNLTDQEKDNCAECGDAYECGDATGEAEPDQTLVTVIGVTENPGSPGYMGYAIAYVGDVTADLGLGEDLWPFAVRQRSDCEAVAGPFPCGRAWGEEVGAGLECVTCDLPGEVLRPDDTAEDMPICGPLGTGQVWRAALNSDETLPATDWAGSLTCGPHFGDSFVCPDGMIGMQEDGSQWPHMFEMTCACPTGEDASCQPGAVCESSWVVEGFWPHPTVCGTPTAGAAPSGPVVYGLDAWEDGIIADGDAITLTPAMYIGLIPAALNDDQTFGMLGDLTHAGPDSLAAHLSLRVGDIVQPDQRELDVLEGGGVAHIPVMRDGVVLRVLEVVIE